MKRKNNYIKEHMSDELGFRNMTAIYSRQTGVVKSILLVKPQLMW